MLDIGLVFELKARTLESQEVMPLIKSCSAVARGKNIAELIKSGRKPKQAIAISYSICRQLKKKKK